MMKTKISNILKSLMAAALLFTVAGCVDENSSSEFLTPSVKVDSHSFVNEELVIKASVSGISNVKECGFIYGKDQNLVSSSDIKATVGKQFSVSIKGLQLNTTYYFQSYIGNGRSKIYSDVFAATTPKEYSSERDALIAIYNAAGGNRWTNNTKWNTPSPISEWYGVRVNMDGNVTSITLNNNNLQGHIPAEIGDLKKLSYLEVSSNSIESLDLSACTSLANLVCHSNQLSYIDIRTLSSLADNVHFGCQKDSDSNDISCVVFMTESQISQKWLTGWSYYYDNSGVISCTNPVYVSTDRIDELSTESAVLHNTVINPGKETVKAKGVCFSSTSDTPDIADDDYTSDGSGDGEYTSSLTDLQPATKYYVRPYLKCENTTYYGKTVDFTTENGEDSNQIIITANGVSFTMIKVEGGTFTMGATSEQGTDYSYDETPAHQVTLTDDYYIGKYEVTQELWEAVTGNRPTTDGALWDNSTGFGANYPAYYVSWNDIQTFISQLNTLTGRKFALPTEAQWEYAARGGNKSMGYKYSGSNIIEEVAWFYDNSGESTHPVGLKSPNELGIYDMSGNVSEWCIDWYGDYVSESQTNPSGPESGFANLLRGGSRFDYSSGCRVSRRYSYSPGTRTSGEGFRLVLLDTPAPELPNISTDEPSSITSSSAVSGGNVTSDGGASVTARGVCWSTSQNPTVSLSTKTTDGTGTGTFTSSITGLTANTKYYLRAYATNSAGTAYGEQKVFTTGGDNEGSGNDEYEW